MQQIIQWVKNDPLRCKALEGVFRLQLPECYIAAGFVRNLVWDHLHKVETSTPLNDIDVIYYDPENLSVETEFHYEQLLSQWMPDVNWQVRNQARMHAQNGDAPYTGSIEAMRYWPEIETAVAIRQLPHQQYECVSAFGFESLMSLQVTPNPKRDITVVEQRIVAKRWLSQWPKLQLNVTILPVLTDPHSEHIMYLSKMTFFERFEHDIVAGKKTITLRDEAEKAYEVGSVVPVSTFEDDRYFCDLKILSVEPIRLEDLTIEHAQQENMTLDELVSVIGEIYPGVTQLYAICFELATAE